MEEAEDQVKGQDEEHRNTAEIEARLLALIREVLGERKLERLSTACVIGLDSSFDRDLGLDSLGRMELMMRAQRAFGVSLTDQVLASAETLRDLLQAILAAAPSRTVGAILREEPASESAAEDLPRSALTLLEVLDWHLAVHPEKIHIQLYGDSPEPEPISYQALAAGARRLADGLLAHGLQPGQSVAIMLPTGREYLFSFFGILMAGGVPVPIYPPARPSQLEDHLRRHAGILDNAQAILLVTVEQARNVGRLLLSKVATLREVVTFASLPPATEGGRAALSLRSDAIAFLQYTSGSTGNPKGVQLSHANLLANIRAMGRAVDARPGDVFVSWLPLYHDMGLIGAWLGSLYHGFPLVLMSPLSFLAQPERWLWAIHHHRGTLSAAPNFAYEMCLRKIAESALEGLDLETWRLAFNGAEPVSPQTVRRFSAHFRRYGLRAEAMAPVYGLAESSVGLAFPPLGRRAPIDRVQRDRLQRRGEAVPSEDPAAEADEFVACGRVLEDHQIRIVDALGRELPERREGQLQFRGPSCTRGYFRNSAETARLFDGEWLNSGDRAYLAGGEVYLTGRSKDLIIRAGRNIYPYEVEQAVGEVPGIRKGCVAVFGVRESATQTERIVVLAETRENDSGRQDQLREEVARVATDLLGMPPDEVVLAPPHSVLKTSSGKIRRAASRDMYEQGTVGRATAPVWIQVLRLLASSLPVLLRRLAHGLTERATAVYLWLIFGLLAIPVWPLILVLPGRDRRWSVLRGAARLLASLARVPVSLSGKEHLLQAGPSVLAANHASYLDGIALVAALPVRVAFVAKSELRTWWPVRRFLERIGCVFVERFDARAGVADARALVSRAREDHLLFFPEGTFTGRAGLLPFRMGAFVVASEAGVPVIPVSIRGTRGVLADRVWFPRRGQIKVIVSPPQKPADREWSSALHLRDAVRREILRQSGEPDL